MLIEISGGAAIIILSVYIFELHLFVACKLTTYSPGLENIKDGFKSVELDPFVKSQTDEYPQLEKDC